MTTFAKTERLILREILPEDRDGMFELDSDPMVHQYLGNKPVKSIEEVDEIIAFVRQQYDDYGIGRWAVIEKSSGNFVGWSGLKREQIEVNGYRDYYDLGYRLIRKYWGNGYATESAQAALAYGFNHLNLPKIYAAADIANKASNAILTKLGFTKVSTFDFNGEACNWYECTQASWMHSTQS